jgi:deazaflavin-dependent oxidoreductase (nitroreductase family)
MLTVLVVVVVALLVYIVGLGLFERLAPRRWVRAYQRTVNPWFRWGAGFAFGFAVIETTGRRTRKARQIPVGGRLRCGVFWTVASDGRYSAWVRNIEANPRVRVRVHGRWRQGVAEVQPDDNPRRRLLRLNPVNSLFVLIAGKHPLSVRITLDD